MIGTLSAMRRTLAIVGGLLIVLALPIGGWFLGAAHGAPEHAKQAKAAHTSGTISAAQYRAVYTGLHEAEVRYYLGDPSNTTWRSAPPG